ncbi:hypothetical protein BpHYR1_038912 [Brachionus plicatilis]|uniref:Uncharacterized protein n=1 Tax=Brachionus plicatilis TaxID=10195 RepID=A0A3M7S0E0_BRAPC|nr:hypothetical protein BpHYR1_038912 [Brachionus plicatilis]
MHEKVKILNFFGPGQKFDHLITKFTLKNLQLINFDNFLRTPTYLVLFIKIKIIGFEVFKLSCISINFLSFAQYSITCGYQMKYKLTIQFRDHVFIFFTEDFLKE